MTSYCCKGAWLKQLLLVNSCKKHCSLESAIDAYLVPDPCTLWYSLYSPLGKLGKSKSELIEKDLRIPILSGFGNLQLFWKLNSSISFYLLRPISILDISWTLLNSSPYLSVKVLIQSLESPVHIPTYNSLRVNKVISKYPSGFSFHPASGLSVRDLYLCQLKHSALGLSSIYYGHYQKRGQMIKTLTGKFFSIASLIFLTVMVPMQDL